ncbi:hypothetical protein [Streptomyces sp. NPDC031705]|uniref:hypothetical protein n=1 Tax=Streptomyces sp. NPDC031705 TaxID=3155729 RepID=UPI0033FD68E3
MKDADLDPFVTRAAPDLIALPGVGTVTAGQLLITAGANPLKRFVAREVSRHLSSTGILNTAGSGGAGS